MSEYTLQFGPYVVEISSAEKLFFPDLGLTKEDVVNYYREVSNVLLRHARDRPVSLQRFPDGIDAAGFYQKEVPDYFPDWIDRITVEVRESGERQDQVQISNSATLAYLANQGTITMHRWLSRAGSLDRPDLLIFDLDPPGSEFAPVRAAARLLRGALDERGLVPYVMTTGSRGLHVVAPLNRSAGFDAVRQWAKNLASDLADEHHDWLTVEPRKDARRGRLFLDYLRNSYGQTAVTPYAIRARPGAPVATPLEWSELDDPALRSDRYTVENIGRRLQEENDPWRGMLRRARALPD